MSCGSSERRNALRYVACVSYPRSGHHLTVRLLTDYFQEDFRYCTFYDRPEGCCQQFPCSSQDVRLTKNHDMELGISIALGIPKVPEVPYLVLVRNFLEAVVSDYNLFLRRQPSDDREAWQAFACRKMEYYRRFVRKWLMSDDGLEKLVVRYEDLTSQPEANLGRMVNFFCPLVPVKLERLREVVAAAPLEDVRPTETQVVPQFGVRNRRRVEEFQHFDTDFFAQLESQLWPELSHLGYVARYAA